MEEAEEGEEEEEEEKEEEEVIVIYDVATETLKTPTLVIQEFYFFL